MRESQREDERLMEYFTNNYGQERSYRMPLQVRTLEDMKQRVTEHFPLKDMPQIFGLHETATLKATTDEAANILHQTYIYQFVVKRPKRIVLNQSQANRNEQMVYDFYRAKLLAILVDVPKPVRQQDVESALPIHKDRRMNTLLATEILRYNALIGRIKANLDQTLAAIEGTQNHTEETEATFMSLQYQRTPGSWTEACYPAHDDLDTFVDNLIERYRYVKDLLSKAKGGTFSGRRFWLPGFFSQKNLLTALMQDVSRRYKISVERLATNFRIMNEGERPQSDEEAVSSNSYYIDGLWMYGAWWDPEKRVL